MNTDKPRSNLNVSESRYTNLVALKIPLKKAAIFRLNS